MMGKDIERIVSLLNNIKDETSNQIDRLAKLSDYRLSMIDHTHSVHTRAETGSSEGTPDGGHDCSDPHVHAIDLYLTGRNDPIATLYEQLEPNHSGPIHVKHVSDQLTYPTLESRGYPNDLHSTHEHIEPARLYEREHCEDALSFTATIFSISNVLGIDANKMKVIQNNMYTNVNDFNTQYGSPWHEIYILQEKISIMHAYACSFPKLQWIGEKHSLLSLMQIVLSYTIDAKWAITQYHDWIQRAYDNIFNDNNPSITWDKFDKSTIGQFEQEYQENVNIKKPSNDPY